MGNIRDIKNRIESIKNTRQITNAMKMVAAAKLRKAQNSIIAARPYADHINRMLMTIRCKENGYESRAFNSSRKNPKRLMVVVTADRGLAGSFNSQIIKAADEHIKKNEIKSVFCIGRKGFDHFKKIDLNMEKSYIGLFNEMNFALSVNIAEDIKNLFFSGNYDQIDVVYNEFKSVIQQNIVKKTIFPIPENDAMEGVSTLDYLYEPDQEEVIEELTKKYVDVELWRILLESSAAEQGARMTAMDSATDNATELIHNLTLEYNMVRQSAITTEIIEISSGAEAQNQ